VKLIDVYPENYPDPEEAAGGKRVLDALGASGRYQQLLRANRCGQVRNSWRSRNR